MAGEVAGTKISAGWPSTRAAYATARPKLPPEAASTPLASTSAVSIRLNAPRGLNDPVLQELELERQYAVQPERAGLQLEHRRGAHVRTDQLCRRLDVEPRDVRWLITGGQ